MVGKTLQKGKYRIVKVLGQGGFGITYEGVQTGLNRRIAIKEFFMSDYCERDGGTPRVTVVGTYGNRQLVERFKQKFIKEAQMIAGLDGVKHIIRIYDVFEENNTAYYVMDYIEGGSLRDFVMQRGRLDESTARRYISQLADALSVLHSRRIMHLDIKPDNILLKDGKIVLIDFGISKHYDQWGNATTTTPVGRSKGYAPIEQYQQGGVQSFSPETDIYSMGATLYFLLTAQTPPEATLLVTSPISFPPYVSSNMRTAISKAMQPSKNDRPHTVGNFVLLLGHLSTKQEISKYKTVYDEEKVAHIRQVVQSHKKADSNVSARKMLKWAIISLVAIAILAILIQSATFIGRNRYWKLLDADSTNIDSIDVEHVDDIDQSTVKTLVKDIQLSCPDENHPHAIDLGLPSGTKWACCDLGVSHPSQLGNPFEWGLTNSNSRDIVDDENYPYTDKDNKPHCYSIGRNVSAAKLWNNNSTYDGTDISNTQYDAAANIWGGDWKMPNHIQGFELVNKCKGLYYDKNGVIGYLIIGPNGNRIFIRSRYAKAFRWLSFGINDDLENQACVIEFQYFREGVGLDISTDLRSTTHAVRPVTY